MRKSSIAVISCAFGFLLAGTTLALPSVSNALSIGHDKAAPASTAKSCAAPVITSVGSFSTAATQTVKIKGRCFGSQPAYSQQDSDFLRIADNTSPRNWAACHTVPDNFDSITCSVASWSPTEIIFTGFSGTFGQGSYTIKKGDSISVSVWNPTSGAIATTAG